MRNKLVIIWAVLRGRPAAYRIGFTKGGVGWATDASNPSRRAYFQECEFWKVRFPTGSTPGPGFQCLLHRVPLEANGTGDWRCPMDDETVLKADLPLPPA